MHSAGFEPVRLSQISAALNDAYRAMLPAPFQARRPYVRFPYLATMMTELFAPALGYDEYLEPALFRRDRGWAAHEFEKGYLLFTLFPREPALAVSGMLFGTGRCGGYTSLGYQPLESGVKELSFAHLTAFTDREEVFFRTARQNGHCHTPHILSEAALTVLDNRHYALAGNEGIGTAEKFLLPKIDHGYFTRSGRGKLGETLISFIAYQREPDGSAAPTGIFAHGLLSKPCDNIRDLFRQIAWHYLQRINAEPTRAQLLASDFDRLYCQWPSQIRAPQMVIPSL